MTDTMEDYLDLHAPQWIDFTETCSPIRMQDFFEKTHSVHERDIKNLCDSISESTENVQPVFNMDVTCSSTKIQADLDIIKSTPIKVSPKCNNKKVVVEATYDQVLNDAMRTLEFCKKSFKTREAPNKITQDSNVFKTPNMSKSSRSIGCRSIPNKYIPSGQNSVPRSMKINKSILDNDASTKTKTSVSQVLFKQDHPENDIFKKPSDLTDGFKDIKEKQCEEKNEQCNEKLEKDIKKCNETDEKEHNEEDDKDSQDELQDESKKSSHDNKEIKKDDNQDDVDTVIKKDNRIQSSNKHSVLTWYNHRRSLQKRRVSSANKKYVSLAEAVSRFQNETPERFRTRSNKANNMSMSLNMSKMTQNRLKPTIPISPALLSKNRTRPVTVLSREEREKLEMEEMKKHRIKANPIPSNVLRGSRVITKKPTAAAHTSTTESNEKACDANLLQPKNSQSHSRDKVSSGSKNVVTKLLVTDPSGFIVEHEEITFFGVPTDTGVMKNVTRIVPFSFEARNKNLQMKKEQRLKSLQEASKAKPEFHARPVPNFSKPPTPSAKQPQQNTKKSILPCPFSFDDRDKKTSEKKGQLMKQMLEEDKRARVFRANPVPVFKPVMIRGRSKENLLAKDKNNTKIASEQAEDQENKEPNVDSSKVERKNIQKIKNADSMVNKQKQPLKAHPLKLNTDKRAKKRCEFDEKIRRKEIEEETKHQEAEKKRLESEKMMTTKLRKLMEVKARPMPTYKSPLVIKATKQLTDPRSPAFASKFKSKHMNAMQ